jgi:hypothetical protein
MAENDGLDVNLKKITSWPTDISGMTHDMKQCLGDPRTLPSPLKMTVRFGYPAPLPGIWEELLMHNPISGTLFPGMATTSIKV